MLTHVPPWYDPQDALREARTTYDGDIEVARAGSRSSTSEVGARRAGSHLLRGPQPEQVEAGDDRAHGEPAEREPRRAGGRIGLEHRAALVEGGERLGDLEQVAAQAVRLECVADLGDDRAEVEQEQGERTLGGSSTTIAPAASSGVVPAARKIERIRAAAYCR